MAYDHIALALLQNETLALVHNEPLLRAFPFLCGFAKALLAIPPFERYGHKLNKSIGLFAASHIMRDARYRFRCCSAKYPIGPELALFK